MLCAKCDTLVLSSFEFVVMSLDPNIRLLIDAVHANNTADVQRLIHICDPKAFESSILRTAANMGHTECVRLLIPVSNPRALDSQVLTQAACGGHIECIKLLIPVCDPKANNSVALQWAIKRNKRSCVKLLLPVSDSYAALHQLRNDEPDQSEIWDKWEQEFAEHQRKKLSKNIVTNGCRKSTRKM